MEKKYRKIRWRRKGRIKSDLFPKFWIGLQILLSGVCFFLALEDSPANFFSVLSIATTLLNARAVVQSAKEIKLFVQKEDENGILASCGRWRFYAVGAAIVFTIAMLSGIYKGEPTALMVVWVPFPTLLAVYDLLSVWPKYRIYHNRIVDKHLIEQYENDYAEYRRQLDRTREANLLTSQDIAEQSVSSYSGPAEEEASDGDLFDAKNMRTVHAPSKAGAPDQAIPASGGKDPAIQTLFGEGKPRPAPNPPSRAKGTVETPQGHTGKTAAQQQMKGPSGKTVMQQQGPSAEAGAQRRPQSPSGEAAAQRRPQSPAAEAEAQRVYSEPSGPDKAQSSGEAYGPSRKIQL